MTIHVLFSENASPDPLLALALADEVQYRCAGYIEAEIERFADELEDLSDEEESVRAGSEGSDEEDTQTIKKRKRATNGAAKPKPHHSNGICSLTSRRSYRYLLLARCACAAFAAGAPAPV